MSDGTTAIILAGAGFCAAAIAVLGVLLYVNRPVGATAVPPPPTGNKDKDSTVDVRNTNRASDPTLPQPSRHDDRCVTSMGNRDDNGSCMALLYNHCIDGYKDQSRIPVNIRSAKSSLLRQMYDNEKKHFDAVPKEWTTVCVARPDKAGSGSCKGVVPGEVRVWTKGRQDPGTGECQFSSLYIKAHFNPDMKLQNWRTGTVGNG